jgi:hypothetical protein
MRTKTNTLLPLFVVAGICLLPAGGQEKPNAGQPADLSAYDVRREVTLIGTVQEFVLYAPATPLGAHAVLQTAAGAVDVHLGDVRLLTANQFSIKSGDTLRIIGEQVAYGRATQFVARIVQKGTRVLVVRSIRGIPLLYMAPRNATATRADGAGS